MAKSLQQLKHELDWWECQMPQTFEQQRIKNQSMFVLSRDIEKLENPVSYEENKSHWESYEFRM